MGHRFETCNRHGRSIQIEKGFLETSVFLFVLDCSFKLKFDKIEGEKIKGSIMSKGLLISIEGPDGAGKTTVLGSALPRLREAYQSKS